MPADEIVSEPWPWSSTRNGVPPEPTESVTFDATTAVVTEPSAAVVRCTAKSPVSVWPSSERVTPWPLIRKNGPAGTVANEPVPACAVELNATLNVPPSEMPGSATETDASIFAITPALVISTSPEPPVTLRNGGPRGPAAPLSSPSESETFVAVMRMPAGSRWRATSAESVWPKTLMSTPTPVTARNAAALVPCSAGLVNLTATLWPLPPTDKTSSKPWVKLL